MHLSPHSNLNTLWAELTIATLIANGVRQFYISPGSRSTPLTLAASKHPQARCRMIYDERSAAFQALGYARYSGIPAALICTSGTAVANYYPAVIEAAQDMVPLVVLSADRPPLLRDCGANQTIQQQHIFGHYVREFVEMPVPQASLPPRFVVSRLEQALFKARSPVPGPVHINFPFAEPLTPAPPQAEAPDYAKQIQALKLPHTCYHTAALSKGTPVFSLLSQCQGLFIIGRLPHHTEKQAILDLAHQLKWPVFADPLSNLRAELDTQDYGISNYDLLLRQSTFKETLTNAQFEVVLHLGQGFVSKALLQFLERYLTQHPHCQYIQVTSNPRPQDPTYQVAQHIVQDPTDFAKAVLNTPHPGASTRRPSPIEKELTAEQEGVQSYLKDWARKAPWSELKMIHLGLQNLGNLPLFVGNSMVIRDVDSLLTHQTMLLIGSRGTSGIDGNIAMLAGVISAAQTPCALLCGDLTLYHDLNSLGTLSDLPAGAILIVINNGGGGIFSFLPVAHPQGGVGDPERVDQYFGTPHNWSFQHAAQMFHLRYDNPQNAADFVHALQQARLHTERGVSTLIELDSDRALNYQYHQDFYQLKPLN